MRKLGLIGGIGPESTTLYYGSIIREIQKHLGEEVYPPMAIESIDMTHMLALCDESDLEGLTAYLGKAVDAVAAAGADFAALASNTPHMVFDELALNSPLPLISIVESTVDYSQEQGLARLGLLGTSFTMKGDFYKKPFRNRSIDIAVPLDDEQNYIHGKIFAELEYGIVKDGTRAAFIDIIQRMERDDSIQGVVLGCTELPLLLKEGDVALPLLDTTMIHVEKLVEEILKEHA